MPMRAGRIETSMPLPPDPFASLVSSLAKGARAAYPFIRGLAVSQPGLSATAIYDRLSGAGFPLRKQTTLDIVSLLRNKGDLVRFQRTFGSSAIIPDSLHTLSPVGFSKGARVQYLVGFKSSNPLIPDAIYVNSRTNLSIDQVFSGALATVSQYTGPGAWNFEPGDITELSIDDAKYAPGAQLSGEFPAPEL